MTRDQQNVIWIGLILIALNIVVNLGQFKATVFGKGPTGDASNQTPQTLPAPGTSNPPVAPGPMNPTFGGNGNAPQQTPPSVMVA